MALKNLFSFLLILVMASTASVSAKVKPVKEDPEMLISQLAQLNMRYQDYPQAIVAYQKLLDQYPESKLTKDYIYYLALAYERSNNFQTAAENYQKVVTDYKNAKSDIPDIDSLSLEGVGRCFTKNFREYAAIINGQPITKLELDAELEKVPAQYRSQFESAAGRKKFLDQLIERKLFLAEAEKQGVINNPDTYASVLETKQNVLMRGLYDQEVIKKSQPSEKEIANFYKKNIKDYKTPEQVRASQIIVDNYYQAQKISRELSSPKGQPFDSLVIKYSSAPNAKSGGKLGLINKDQNPAPDPALFKTPKGKYTRVISSEPQYAIVKLEKKEGKKLHLSWIVTKTEDEAKKVLDKIKTAPDSFSAIAGNRSLDDSKNKGGDLGFVTKDQVPPEIFKAASKLTPGKYTIKPVKYFTSYIIYRIEDKIKAGVKSLELVKYLILEKIQKERQPALYESLQKRLMDEAKIEYFIETPEAKQPQEKPEIKPEPKTNKPPKSGK